MVKKTKPPLEKVAEKAAQSVETRRISGYRLRLVQIYLLVAVGAFLALALLASRVSYFPIDLVITRSIQLFQVVWFDVLMRFVSEIGFHPQMTIIMVVAGLILLLLGLWWEALIGAVSWAGAVFAVITIKEIVGRPRPSFDLVQVVARLKEYSFPSGHVVIYTVFFGYLWFLTYVLLKKSPIRTFMLILFGGFVLLVGPSRVYLGAHWASDTAGAYILGSVILLITIFIYRWGKNRFFKKQPVATEIKEV